jgi:hypothetical protein
VLAVLRPGLEKLGFQVEAGKKLTEKIRVPVLFGRNGIVEKAFEADAWHRQNRMVIEVEAGRGYLNNQFLKDLFQACMMQDVDYCGIAVRNRYIENNNFENVVSFFETLHTSGRLSLPLKGVLVLGYGHAASTQRRNRFADTLPLQRTLNMSPIPVCSIFPFLLMLRNTKRAA